MSPIDSFWLGTFIFDSDRDLNVDDDGDGKKYSFCSYSFIKMFCLNVVFIKNLQIYIYSEFYSYSYSGVVVGRVCENE